MKSKKRQKLLITFTRWRLRNVTDKQLIYFLSVIVGLLSGVAAFILKSATHLIRYLLHLWSPFDEGNFLYFFLPMVGIAIAVIFVKYVIKTPIRHGVPSVLYAISVDNGRIAPHNTFSSIITSAFTAGFGGSVGLEGPSIVTGAAIGSNMGGVLRLNHKQKILLIACGATGVMAAIFNAPVAAIVFALEVIVFNLSMTSIVPLLLASSSATLTSYLFWDQDVLFRGAHLYINEYSISDVPSFIVIGVLTGLISVYFKRMYLSIERFFDSMASKKKKLFVGGGLLGLLLYFFPSLYGEGYEFINMTLQGDFSYLYSNSVFSHFHTSFFVTCLLFLAVIFIKGVASALTFGAGGAGGIFAPSLFIGANVGLCLWFVFNNFDIDAPIVIFVLLGMCGTIAGVMHAPLTGFFLIADISNGYKLFVPLMLVSAISYATVRIFEDTSVYTHLLSKRKQLLSHNKDASVLSLMQIHKLIEKDFITIHVNSTLGDLVEVIKTSKRNIYPVIDDDGVLHGIVKLDDVRHLIFDPENYKTTFVRTLMYMPRYFFAPSDDMAQVAHTIQKSGHYNFPILDNGVYIGFISKAKLFSEYRKITHFFSEE